MSGSELVTKQPTLSRKSAVPSWREWLSKILHATPPHSSGSRLSALDTKAENANANERNSNLLGNLRDLRLAGNQAACPVTVDLTEFYQTCYRVAEVIAVNLTKWRKQA
jgi:hypothetical protein